MANASSRPRKLSDDELLAAVRSELRDTVGGDDGQISEQRRKSLRYYHGKPFGNEVEGRSRVVLNDVLEVVEWMMPSLMRTFAGARQIGRYLPVGAEDVEMARQATAYAHHTFTRYNNGFLIFYSWFKDALREKNGFVKYGWEKVERRHSRRLSGVTTAELSAIVEQYDADVIEKVERTQTVETNEVDPATGHPISDEVKVLDAKIAWTSSSSCFKVYNVAPEEFLISQRATLDMDTARCVAWRRPITRGELVALGYDEESVALLPTDDPLEYEAERIERFEEEDSGQSSAHASRMSPDWASQQVYFAEVYLRVDQDGDGIRELRRVCVGGGREAFEILRRKDGGLDNEEVDEIPFATVTPVIEPHRFYGKAESELTMDLQLIRSTVLRNILDNFYQVNNNRYVAIEGEVEISDLTTSRPGGVVRARSQGAVQPLVTNPLSPMAFNILEYLQTVRENRTGITRYNQGTDATSLNQTATGIRSIMGASKAREDLINRLFSETGVKRLFKALLRACVEHAEDVRGTLVQIDGDWQQIDPARWNPDMDVEVEVGLGAGDAEVRMAQLTQLATVQEKIAGGGGLGILVTPENIYNLAVAVQEELGFKDRERFFSNPAGKQPPPPPPDPAMLKVQAEIELKKAELALEQQRMAMELETDKQKLALEQMKAKAQIALAIQRADAEVRINRMRAVGQQVMESSKLGHRQTLDEARLTHEVMMEREEASRGEGQGQDADE